MSRPRPARSAPARPPTQDPTPPPSAPSQQEKIGDVYKLHGDAEIHYRTYILRADEVTYNSDSGEATGSGHFTLDGGPNDEHIKASHGTYNLTAETGRFYDVIGNHRSPRSRQLRRCSPQLLPLRSPARLSRKPVPTTISSMTAPSRPANFPIPIGNSTRAKSSSMWAATPPIYPQHVHGCMDFRFFYFPYATHPVDREARETGFLVPTGGRSSTNGNEIGDAFYWAINRSMDATDRRGIFLQARLVAARRISRPSQRNLLRRSEFLRRD